MWYFGKYMPIYGNSKKYVTDPVFLITTPIYICIQKYIFPYIFLNSEHKVTRVGAKLFYESSSFKKTQNHANISISQKVTFKYIKKTQIYSILPR